MLFDSTQVDTIEHMREVATDLLPWENNDEVKVSKEVNMGDNHSNRRKYYKEHRDEILADLRSIGRVATCEKWSIPRTTLHSLEKRLLTPEERASIPSIYTKRGMPASTPPLPTTTAQLSTPLTEYKNNQPDESPGILVMPRFPEFNPAWQENVQLAWFEIYGHLLRAWEQSPHPNPRPQPNPNIE